MQMLQAMPEQVRGRKRKHHQKRMRPSTKRIEDTKGSSKSAKRLEEGQHPQGITHDGGCGGKKVVMISRGIEISITGDVEETEDVSKAWD